MSMIRDVHEPATRNKRWLSPSWIPSWIVVAFLVMAPVLGKGAAAISGFFGPPSAVLAEAYSVSGDGPTFDHSTFDELLKRHVSADGWVDYVGLKKDAKALDRYIAALARVSVDALDRNEKLCLLINGYNAFTLRLILDYYPIDSIKDIPASKRWKHKRWRVGAHTWSLDQIEHEQIRPEFREPRVHFALVCAAVGCPKLRNEAYRADRIEAQLDDQTRYLHSHDRWFRFDAGQNVLHLTKLYKWYGGDFEQAGGKVMDFAARYAPQLRKALDAGQKPRIQWLDYDWKLNDKKRAR